MVLHLMARNLPTVEYGCLEAILVKTSFQFGLAKWVLTCKRKNCLLM